MKKIKENVIRGYITSIIGIIICYVTYKQIDTGKFSFVWEGLAGFGLGIMLILAPDDFIRTSKKLINKYTKSEKE